MIVSPKMIQELKKNNRLKGLIAIDHQCTVHTIERWLRQGDIKKLTAAAALHIQLIKKETNWRDEDILIEVETIDTPKREKNK